MSVKLLYPHTDGEFIKIRFFLQGHSEPSACPYRVEYATVIVLAIGYTHTRSFLFKTPIHLNHTSFRGPATQTKGEINGPTKRDSQGWNKSATLPTNLHKPQACSDFGVSQHYQTLILRKTQIRHISCLKVLRTFLWQKIDYTITWML